MMDSRSMYQLFELDMVMVLCCIIFSSAIAVIIWRCFEGKKLKSPENKGLYISDKLKLLDESYEVSNNLKDKVASESDAHTK